MNKIATLALVMIVSACGAPPPLEAHDYRIVTVTGKEITLLEGYCEPQTSFGASFVSCYRQTYPDMPQYPDFETLFLRVQFAYFEVLP